MPLRGQQVEKKKMLKRIAVGLACLTLAACAGTNPLPRSAKGGYALPQTTIAEELPSLNITSVEVIVPETLSVSEENAYYPSSDILWVEEPVGDRYAQVEAIILEAARAGTKDIKGETRAKMTVELLRFHALTKRARYTIGGVHAIRFMLTLSDPATGEALTEPRLVIADFRAYGGRKAIAAEAEGITQRVRIVEHLTSVFTDELTAEEGYKPRNTGILGLVNEI